MYFFQKPIKELEKLLTIFTSFWIKFIYLCLRQVYGVSSSHLFPAAFVHLGSNYYKKNKLTSVFLCVCPLIDDKFRHNIVKGYCGTTRLRLVLPQPLWQCSDTIYHQWEDRSIKNWIQFVTLHCFAKRQKTQEKSRDPNNIWLWLIFWLAEKNIFESCSNWLEPHVVRMASWSHSQR